MGFERRLAPGAAARRARAKSLAVTSACDCTARRRPRCQVQLDLAGAGHLAAAQVDELRQLGRQSIQVETGLGRELIERAGALDVQETRIAS